MRNVGIEYPARGEMHFFDLGEPGPLGPFDVLIRTRYSGITNGTERHALVGEHLWGQYPSAHGYQQVGQIEDAGSEVEDFAPGDWVYYGHYVGHRAWNVQTVASADQSSNDSHLVIALPEDVDRKLCALMGVAGVAMRGVRRMRVGPGQNVWVAGAGPIGQFSAQCARAVGARVTVTDVNERRLQIARELGADRVVNVSGESLDILQDEGPYDCIVDCCGVESLLLDIHHAQLLAHGGVVGCMAVRTNTEFIWSMLHGREASIEVSCHYSLDDLRVLSYFIRKGVVRIGPVVTHTVPVEKAPEIYAALRDRPGELLGVVFEWGE